MPEIVLTEDQWTPVAGTVGRVEVKDPAGRVIGWLEPPPSAEQIAEWKRIARSSGPWFTSEQVFARLRALEAEWERTGGFDEVYSREFMAGLNADDPGHFHDPESPR